MIPIEIKVIVLGCLIIGCLEYLKDRKRKKEQKMQDRLNQALSNINNERNKRHE